MRHSFIILFFRYFTCSLRELWRPHFLCSPTFRRHFVADARHFCDVKSAQNHCSRAWPFRHPAFSDYPRCSQNVALGELASLKHPSLESTFGCTSRHRASSRLLGLLPRLLLVHFRLPPSTPCTASQLEVLTGVNLQDADLGSPGRTARRADGIKARGLRLLAVQECPFFSSLFFGQAKKRES